MVEEAEKWLGTPYGYGRSERGVATDCSGMVLEVYKAVKGVNLPRNSKAQAEFCAPVAADAMQPGDLVFFALGRDSLRVSHVGIMKDHDSFIHASSSKGVIVSSMNLPYWRKAFVMFGRP